MLQPHQFLGPYRIVRFLGAGGMGSVYEVEHGSMGTRHALKVLGDQYLQNDSVRQRFRREAQLMFQLGNHPHIVRATDLIENAETMALVVDLVTGGDLGQGLEERPGRLSWPEAWEILEPILAAVAYAHDRNVVHRDLKPENVLLQPNGGWPGTPLVADFGIAKVIGAESATRTQTRMGTACYGSPEQFKNAKDVGAEADVWALGMLAWRLVTGRLPIDPENQLDLLRMYTGELAIPMLPGVPKSVATAVAAALQVNPQRRPRDAGVLGKLLRAHLDERPVTAEEPRPLTASALAAGNKNLVVAIVGFAAVWLLGAAYLIARDSSGGSTLGSAGSSQSESRFRVRPGTPDSPPAGMVYLAPGKFRLGNVGESSGGTSTREVEVGKGFFLDRTEVTVDAYRECVVSGPCSAPDKRETCNWDVPERGDHPVNCVDWTQAREYCAWRGLVLPSEAQWEYAARSGGKSDFRYPWGTEPATCERAIIADGGDGCGKRQTWRVCSKSAGNSLQGACDLAGNVAEWVEGQFDGPSNDHVSPRNPFGPRRDESQKRTLRGGSWFCDHADNVRATSRTGSPPNGRNNFVGFRCAMNM